MLDDLYQEIILDHTKKPRNFGPLEGADRSSEGYNPLCGDRVTLHVKLDGDRLAGVTFEGSGCAISTASASLLTETLAGKTKEEAREIFEAFHALLAGDASGVDRDLLGKLVALAGVREFPMRVKCATLAWHTLQAALKDAPAATEEPVSTE